MVYSASLINEIENIEDNADNIRQLIEQLKTPIGIIPFVGAGLSIPFGFPGWSTFLTAQAKRAGADIEENIKQRLNRGEYEDAAEDLLKARGYLAFHDAIENTFAVHKLPGKELKGAVSYLPDLAAGPVITTNFDPVLEEVFRENETPFERVVWGVYAETASRAFYQNRKFLLKIHGDAEESTNRILTKSDYGKYYGSVDGSSIDFSLPLPRLLQQMLLGRPLLFLGCSLMHDSTVAVLEKVSDTFRNIAHYAVVEQPASTEIFYERSRFLSNHNIRPIWYPSGQHDLIEPLLAYVVDRASEISIEQQARNYTQRVENVGENIDEFFSKENPPDELIKVVKDSLGKSRDDWLNLLIIRMALRRLLRSTAAAHGIKFSKPTAGIRTMKDTLEGKEIIDGNLQREIERIRAATFTAEWATGKEADPKDVQFTLKNYGEVFAKLKGRMRTTGPT